MIFSSPLEIGPEDARDSNSFGGIAKAADNIAIAVWKADTEYDNPSTYVDVYARALRWSASGVQAGPLTKINPRAVPGQIDGYPMQVRSGRANEVWVNFFEGWNWDFMPLRIAVDPVSLGLSWSSFTDTAVPNYYLTMHVWPQQQRLIFVSASRRIDGSGYYELIMYDFAGTRIATFPLDAWSATNGFDPVTQKILLVCDLPSGGTGFRASTVDVTTSGFSNHVIHGQFTDSGWSGAGPVGVTPWGFNWFMATSYNNYLAKYYTLEFADWTIRNPASPAYPYDRSHWNWPEGTTLSLLNASSGETFLAWNQYIEPDWDNTQLKLATFPDGRSSVHEVSDLYRGLAATPDGSSWGMVANEVVEVAPGRYIWFASGSLGRKALSASWYGNFTQVAWALGEEVIPPTEGTRPLGGRNGFRRNRL